MSADGISISAALKAVRRGGTWGQRHMDSAWRSGSQDGSTDTVYVVNNHGELLSPKDRVVLGGSSQLVSG